MRSARVRLLGFAATVSLSCLAGMPAWAQTPQGAELHVNSYTTDRQQFSRIVQDTSGGFVVVWESRFQGGQYYATVGQRFNAQGQKRGAEFMISNTAGGGPDVAALPDGGFVVVWGTANGLHARRFSSSGAGAPEVNLMTASGQINPAVAVGPDDNLVVAWHASSVGIKLRRFSPSGQALGSEESVSSTPGVSFPSVAALPKGLASDQGGFVVAWKENSEQKTMRRTYQLGTGTWLPTTTLATAGVCQSGGHRCQPAVRADAQGNYIVAWVEIVNSTAAVLARSFAPDTSQTQRFEVQAATAAGASPLGLAISATGEFALAWSKGTNTFAQEFNAAVPPSPVTGVFQVNSYTGGNSYYPALAAGPGDGFMVTWQNTLQEGTQSPGIYAQTFGRFQAASLAVDAAFNRVFEPGETVTVAPAWRNLTGTASSVSGHISQFTGPPATTYTIVDDTASYGTIPASGQVSCSDCYLLAIPNESVRPQHWDAQFLESLSVAGTPVPGAKTWKVHVGQSFADVPTTNGFYRFIETILHRGIAQGCGGSNYCPATSTLREQMPVFVLLAKEGSGYAPPACGTPVFSDVPASSPYCPWIEELARRGVISSGGNYNPTQAVSRQEVSIFLLRTLDPTLSPTPCLPPPQPRMFADVPASNGFCKWIEELAGRGIASGCGGGNYCPTDPVGRGQMAVFVVATFGLTLYGP